MFWPSNLLLIFTSLNTTDAKEAHFDISDYPYSLDFFF